MQNAPPRRAVKKQPATSQHHAKHQAYSSATLPIYCFHSPRTGVSCDPTPIAFYCACHTIVLPYMLQGQLRPNPPHRGRVTTTDPVACLLPVPKVPVGSPWKHGIIGHLHFDALLQPGKLRLTFATNQPRCHSQDSDRSSLHSGHQDVVDFPLKASFPKPRVVCFSSLTEKHRINHRLHQLYTLTSSSNSIISLLVWTWQSAGDTTIKTRNGEVEGPNTPVLLLVPLKGLPVPRTKSLMLGFVGRK